MASIGSQCFPAHAGLLVDFGISAMQMVADNIHHCAHAIDAICWKTGNTIAQNWRLNGFTWFEIAKNLV